MTKRSLLSKVACVLFLFATTASAQVVEPVGPVEIELNPVGPVGDPFGGTIVGPTSPIGTIELNPVAPVGDITQPDPGRAAAPRHDTLGGALHSFGDQGEGAGTDGISKDAPSSPSDDSPSDPVTRADIDAWVREECAKFLPAQDQSDCVDESHLALIDPKRHAKISKKARGLSDAGSANADVVLWQTLLGGDVAVDGIFGDQTESATIAWQQEHFRTDDGDIDEAAVDGVVGEQTWTRMLEIVSDAKVMELDRALLAVSRPIAESATRQLAKRIREEVRVPRPAGEPERSLDQMVTHGYEPSTPAGLEEDHDFSEMLKSAPSAVRNWLERWANGETNRGGRIPNAVVLFGAAIAANVGWVTWLSLVRRRRVAG